MLNKTSVLLVEDSKPDAKFVRTMLQPQKYELAHVVSLADAAHELKTQSFDVILLDLSLPDGSGLETLEAVKAKSSEVPIIILTGLNDEDTELLAVKLGAQDYIKKSEVNVNFLERSIRYAIERKEAEQKEKRLAVLEQREEFMATLTHDLKNPLIGTNRVLELLAEQAMGSITDEHAELLLQIRDSNKILLLMIQNVLDVYRFEKDIDAVVLDNMYLRDVVLSCLREIKPIAENRNIEITTNFSDSQKPVNGDAFAMRRVFQNLLDNALKFTPPGGKIILNIAPDNGAMCVEIEDNGPGMSQEELSRIFIRFAQGRAGRKYSPGTGLGLFLCKQIVDAHNGEITCQSKEGEGTRFKIIIPAA
jgi:two-component system, sensor histidine kinase and response regulator